MQKIGILGGGQLGKMLLQAAANYPVETYLMEADKDFPASNLAHHFVKGDFKDFDDVYHFGKHLDAVVIEIESVNEEALKKLEKKGVKVYPSPSALTIIKDKVLQKQFYQKHNIPTAEFVITKNKKEVLTHQYLFPAIHKIGLGGYDGRGVIVINNSEDAKQAFDEPAVLERKVDIYKEISIIVAVGNDGKIVMYPAVDMVFDAELNLLDYQLSPADIPDEVKAKAEEIALNVVKNLSSAGIFAVELFVDKANNIFVNETAPRVHNSGHHTIEANYCSQFDMLWRIMLDYPLGNPKHITPAAAIVNLLGSPEHKGKPVYEGLNDILGMDNVFVHIYGKKETRPGKKMGHATILGSDKEALVRTAHKIKETLKITSR
jgi:5-(carboxyamino)imidazole ribonucleotide synthase